MHHVVYQRYVLFRSQAMRCSLKFPWHVNDAEVLLKRAGDIKHEDVLKKGRSRCAFRGTNTHNGASTHNINDPTQLAERNSSSSCNNNTSAISSANKAAPRLPDSHLTHALIFSLCSLELSFAGISEAAI